MKILKFGTFFSGFVILFIFFCMIAEAETATSWTETEQSRLRLIAEFDGVKDRTSVRVGLQIKLAPGWKTYWRSPGDAGIPPRMDWSGSQNVKEVKISWPLPELFNSYGFDSWGYHDEVVFPVDVTLSESGRPLDLNLKLQLGICEDVCIPYEHEFSLFLDASTGERSMEAAKIEEFGRRVPKKIGEVGAVLTEVAASAKEDNRFVVIAQASHSLDKPEIIVEGKYGTYFELISKNLSADRKTISFRIDGHLPSKTDQMQGQDITVTIFDNGVAGEKKLRVD